ncbi:NADH-quinone oxidoreductase subunit L [Chitinophaga nivalis]|uniref:NADH-quinone oxidoreductase subunit L n=1 Tax=Chitinophaga nivalis TaxID=2991709 RepID=A0ABT3ISV4_9BACT|nr:NADH-quinone oxidoreductase subunit L [Chitinophaga nivalis]MCW3463253.1 NADH-quinone oxidoreductase subunit L [Chitinophaga nivalis]MCW3487057.1 NADH-quinone oxidoreductase subunit L [Chitinophaga nivalis]
MINLVWLVPFLPLLGFLVNGLGRRFLSKSLVGFVGSGTVLAAFVISVLMFLEAKAPGFTPQVVTLFDFITVGTLHIPFAFQVDQLSALFLLVITGVGTLIHIYSTSYMHEESDESFARYFAYLNLFVFSMLILVLGANYVMMFIGWEGVGLCSYLLIGFWFKNPSYNNAAKKAFVMNRIGDLGFLLGIFFMIMQFGTVTFPEVFAKAAPLGINNPTLVAIAMLMFVGAMGKSAQIPLYTWLPDAMAGPTPVSALIHAATMVTAGIYMIARSNVIYTLAPSIQTVIAVIGVATALFAASIALKQNDIKKVLAYSTVSQLGYMFLALGVGAYSAAVFHVMTHAFFKALLFLGSGSVIHAMGGEQDIRKMGGLKKFMPTTHWTFLVGCLAIAGIPGFSGFFSKDEILANAFANNPVLYVLGLLGALMTAFYMFRLYFITFSGKFRGTHDQEHHLHESPAAMTLPLIILALLSVFGGYVGLPEVFGVKNFLATYLEPIFAQSAPFATAHHLSHSTEWLLMGISSALVIVMILLARGKFAAYEETGKENTGLAKVLENKWYIDELYDAIIVKPLYELARFFRDVVEKAGIDKLVNGIGSGVQWGGQKIRLVQNGQVGFYIFAMVIGMIVLFVIGFLL